MEPTNEKNTKWKYAWRISNIISVLFLIGLLCIWYKAYYTLEPLQPNQIRTDKQKQPYLSKQWTNDRSNPIYILTGIHVKALKFKSPNDLMVAGYIWQHFPTNLPVNFSHDFNIEDQIEFNKQSNAFDYFYGNDEIVNTYFEAKVRQEFNYKKFPFDHKIIAIEIWRADYYNNVLLVPDFNAYLSNSQNKFLGVANDIAVRDFFIADSYFAYVFRDYDTNFGYNDYKPGIPFLYFAIVIKRIFWSGFVVNLLPLVIVFILIFLILLMSTEERRILSRFKFTGTMLVSNSSTLFFALVLIHVGLRTRLYSNQLMYVEYFYLLAYVLLITVVLNNYILLKDENKKIKFLHYGDNLIPKILFWPLVLLIILIISVGILL